MSEMQQSLPLAAAEGPEDAFAPVVDETRGADASRTEGSSASERAVRRAGRLRVLGRLLRGERGTAVVEFAIVVLPLTLIVFGIIDFGRALNYYNDLTQLAGQGARAAAVNENVDGTAATSDFQKLLFNEADSPELINGSGGGGPMHVCVDGTLPTKAGDPVTVKTTFDFNFIPLVHTGTLTLHASQTERYEGAGPPTYGPGCYPTP